MMKMEKNNQSSRDDFNNNFTRKIQNIPNQPNANDALVNEINKLKKIKMRIRSLEDNEGKWNQLEQNVKVNEEKLDQMSKTMNDLVRSQYDEGINRSTTSQNVEYEKMVQENVTLKADTLIYREDITHLSEVNNKLATELEISRAKILDLLNHNDALQKETEHKALEIDKLTQAITRLRLFDNPEVDFTLENRKNKDQRIRELEYENRLLSENKIKAQTEYQILNERFVDYKQHQENTVKEMTYSKSRENEQISILEGKMHAMELQLDTMGKENITLRLTDDKYRREITLAMKEKDNFMNKYQKKKEELNALALRYNDLNNQYKNLQTQHLTLVAQNNLIKQSETKIVHDRTDDKKKIFNDLYSKIQHYKTQIMTNRNKSPTHHYNTSI